MDQDVWQEAPTKETHPEVKKLESWAYDAMYMYVGQFVMSKHSWLSNFRI